MKRRKQLLKVIEFLRREEIQWIQHERAFFDDPMTTASGCGNEPWTSIARRRRHRFLKTIHELTGNKSPFVTHAELCRYGWRGRRTEFLDAVLEHRA